MQAIDHGTRVGKAFAFEIEIAIITLPIIVNHQDAGGQTIGEQVASIGQNVVLILVVHQLYPRVVLRMREKQGVGQCPFGREMLLHECPISVAQGCALLLDAHLFVARIDVNALPIDREFEWAIAPDGAPTIGNEHARHLVVVVLAREIEGRKRRERHRCA